VTDLHPDDHEAESVDALPNSSAIDEQAADYVYLPPERSALRRVVYLIGTGLGIALILVMVSGWWVLRQVNPSGTPGDAVVLTVPTGSSTAQIGTLLANQGIITSADVFQYYVKFKGAGPFKAGDYDGMYRNDSMDNVINRLRKGPLPPVTRPIVIQEGLWLAEVKAKILLTFPEMNAAELDTALTTVRSKYQPDGVTSLEGLLFPATYQVEKGDEVDEQKLVQQMVSKFDEVGDSIGVDQAQPKVGFSPYEVIEVASMVELEAKLPEDRPKIARVLYNRLAAGMPLGLDATVEYALQQRTASLTASQLKIDSPYNTRAKAGLPPTPIGGAGRSSLEAALSPAPGDWIYYVLADQSGAHYFTADYNDFLKAKRRAQQQGLLGS
jgi:UPF0755 protein